jgi:hypothetical protein
MIAGSNTMTYDEYKKAHIFRWVVMFGHYLGTVQYISRFLHNLHGIPYRQFYEGLLDYMYANPNSFVGQELQKTVNSLEAVLAVEQPWGRILPDVRQNFAWDFEEATAIRVSQNKQDFYADIKDFLSSMFDMKIDSVVEELFEYQILALIDPARQYPVKSEFQYNIHDVITRKSQLRETTSKLNFIADNYNGDYYRWGIEKLWWGRRVAACKAKVEHVST